MRFGYLGSGLATDAPVAKQADAFVALLDHLGPTSVDAREMATMLGSIFPIGPRAPGAVFDAYVGDPEIHSYPSLLSQLRRASPQARLVTLDSGGHLQLGQTERVRTEVGRFLADAPVAP